MQWARPVAGAPTALEPQAIGHAARGECRVTFCLRRAHAIRHARAARPELWWFGRDMRTQFRSEYPLRGRVTDSVR